jgi:hypothetical protein
MHADQTGMEKRGLVDPEVTPPVYEDQLRIVKNAAAGSGASTADLERLGDSLTDRVIRAAKPIRK